MRKLLLRFLQRWLIDTLSVLAATVLPGIYSDDWPHVLFASLTLGIVNTFIRPILMLFTLPLVFLSLGLFIFVINALMLLLVAQIVPGFHVDGLWWALAGAFIITLISTVLGKVTGTSQARVEVRRGPPRNDHRGPPDGGGPVIDV